MNALTTGLLLLLSACAGKGSEQRPMDPGNSKISAKKYFEMHLRQGEMRLGEANARLNLGPEFRYLPRAEAHVALQEYWGYAPSPQVIGLVVPANYAPPDRNEWSIKVVYEAAEYVSPEGLADLNADLLLNDKFDSAEAMAQQAYGNQARPEVRWLSQPYFDPARATIHMFWEVRVAGVDGGNIRYVNYSAYVHGRDGRLMLVGAATSPDVAALQAGMKQLAEAAEFNPGYRYQDR